MPRFVQSQSIPGMATYLNEDGSEGVSVPEDWARLQGYDVEIPHAVELDVPQPVPVVDVGDVQPVPGPAAPQPPAGLPIAAVPPGGPMPTPNLAAPVTAPPPPRQPQLDAVSQPAEAGGPPTPTQPRARDGFETEQQGVSDAAEAEGQRQDSLATGYLDAAGEQLRNVRALESARAQVAQVTADKVNGWRRDVDAFAAQKADPSRFWKTRSDGQKVGAVVSAALAGFLNPRGPNSAVEMIERAVQRDMEAQQMDLSRQHAAIGLKGQAVGMDIDAMNADLEWRYKTGALLYDAAINQANAEAMKYGSKIARANGLALVGQIQQKKDAFLHGVEMDVAEITLKGMQMSARGSGPGKYNPGDLPPGASEERAIYGEDGRAVAYIRAGKDPEADKVREQVADFEDLDRKLVELEQLAKEVAGETGVPLTNDGWWTNNKITGHPKWAELNAAYERVRVPWLKVMSGTAVNATEGARFTGMVPEAPSALRVPPQGAWKAMRKDMRDKARLVATRYGVVRVERDKDGNLVYGGVWDPGGSARQREDEITNRDAGGTPGEGTKNEDARLGLTAREPSVQFQSAVTLTQGWKDWKKTGKIPRSGTTPQQDAAAFRQRAEATRSMLKARDDMDPEDRAEWEQVATGFEAMASELEAMPTDESERKLTPSQRQDKKGQSYYEKQKALMDKQRSK